MSKTFAQLGLPHDLVRSLADAGIRDPFPIQSATIPDALAGRDVSGKAPTGAGKTLAFGLPLLANVRKASRNKPSSLILAPTRELAEQIKRELAPLAEKKGRSVLAVYGGVGYGPQKNGLRRGVEVLVATPGHLEDLMEQGSVDLSRVGIAVVDEADRMADMGFLPAVRRILDKTSRDRQTMLFSATLDGAVAVLSRDYQHDPVSHDAGAIEPKTTDAEHHFWLVQRSDRVRHTAEVVTSTGRTIVFTRTRRGADRVAKQLGNEGVSVVTIHGGRSQRQRNQALRAFQSDRAWAMVATDVAARGIHVDGVAAVVHFDPPQDEKDYVHRSGRTARAGESGTVVSLVTSDQKKLVGKMQRKLGLDEPIHPPGDKALSKPRSRKPERRRSDEHRRQPRQARSLYVANLPWDASSDDVEKLFSRHGEVHKTTIITDRKTGRSKGYAFVDMSHSGGVAAVDALHGSTLGGRSLTVRVARPRRTHAKGRKK